MSVINGIYYYYTLETTFARAKLRRTEYRYKILMKFLSFFVSFGGGWVS